MEMVKSNDEFLQYACCAARHCKDASVTGVAKEDGGISKRALAKVAAKVSNDRC
jgi:hypothetical protein